jgi:hypothetical protein
MNATYVRPALAEAALAAALFTGLPAFAAVLSYKADLKASSEVPPNDSNATGSRGCNLRHDVEEAGLDNNHSGLSGPATAAHFHGPAEVGKNAPPVVPISGNLASPIKGEATLTDAQAFELQGGRWYFNVHTDANKGGEIRGQMIKKYLPRTDT